MLKIMKIEICEQRLLQADFLIRPRVYFHEKLTVNYEINIVILYR